MINFDRRDNILVLSILILLLPLLASISFITYPLLSYLIFTVPLFGLNISLKSIWLTLCSFSAFTKLLTTLTSKPQNGVHIKLSNNLVNTAMVVFTFCNVFFIILYELIQINNLKNKYGKTKNCIYCAVQ